MALWIREIKHKDGTVRKKWYWTLYIPTGEHYPNGKTKYIRRGGSLGDCKEVSKKEAKEIYEGVRDKVAEGLKKIKERKKRRKNKVFTLGEFEDEYIEYVRDIKQKKSWKRDRVSLANLKRLLGQYTYLENIGTADLIAYQSRRLKERVSHSTVNRELACLKHLINVAILQDAFDRPNPFTKSGFKFLRESNNRDRILDPTEEGKLLKALPYYQAIIVDVALNTACRATELITMKWEYVDFKNETITIPLTYVKGSLATKQIDMSSYLKKILKSHKKKTGHQEFVFLTSNGTPWKDVHSLRFFKRACKLLGIEGVTFHTLRHTAITRMLSENSPLDSVARIAGHRNISTTMKYAHKNPADKKSINSLNKFRKNKNFFSGKK